MIAFDQDNVHEDGMPANGNAFITRGYIYPAGTLTESNGTLEDGSPEFPDLVLGEWVCRGWFVGEGASPQAQDRSKAAARPSRSSRWSREGATRSTGGMAQYTEQTTRSQGNVVLRKMSQ